MDLCLHHDFPGTEQMTVFTPGAGHAGLCLCWGRGCRAPPERQQTGLSWLCLPRVLPQEVIGSGRSCVLLSLGESASTQEGLERRPHVRGPRDLRRSSRKATTVPLLGQLTAETHRPLSREPSAPSLPQNAAPPLTRPVSQGLPEGLWGAWVISDGKRTGKSLWSESSRPNCQNPVAQAWVVAPSVALIRVQVLLEGLQLHAAAQLLPPVTLPPPGAGLGWGSS